MPNFYTSNGRVITPTDIVNAMFAQESAPMIDGNTRFYINKSGNIAWAGNCPYGAKPLPDESEQLGYIMQFAGSDIPYAAPYVLRISRRANVDYENQAMELRFMLFKSRQAALAWMKKEYYTAELKHETVYQLFTKNGTTLTNVWQAWSRQADDGEHTNGISEKPEWVKLLNQMPTRKAFYAVYEEAGKRLKHFTTQHGQLKGKGGIALGGSIEVLALYRLSKINARLHRMAEDYCSYPMNDAQEERHHAEWTKFREEAVRIGESLNWTVFVQGDPRGQIVKVVFQPNVNPDTVMYGDFNF